MILYVNACARKASRTNLLGEYLLKRMNDDVKTVNLFEASLPVMKESFIQWRNAMCEAGTFDDSLFDYAKDFASADTIVIAAPFWDLSFPAVLKQYLEQICILNLTFRYENDVPKGLCNAKKLYYVTTAGGSVYSSDYGFGYVKALAETFFGIRQCQMIKAENLDIAGSDPEAILTEARKQIDSLNME